MKTVLSCQLSVLSRLRVVLLFAVMGCLASCGGGGGIPCFAQGAVRAALPVAPIGTFYSPEANLEAMDVAALTSAQHAINLAAFSLTDKAIIAALADRAQHGVIVRIYLDRGELQAECRGDATCARSPLHILIGLSGVEIRVKHSKILMHLKSYAVDAALERDGSANFSEQGEQRQDNSAIFSGDQMAVGRFWREFQGMWTRADNLTVAQAVAGQ